MLDRASATPERTILDAATRRAVLLLVAVIVIWGSNWAIMKIALESAPPLWFAAARMWMGAACLFAVLLPAGRIRWPHRSDLAIIATVGLLQMAIFLGLTHFALLVVEAGRSAVLAYTTPLWVMPLAIIFLGERPTPLKFAGLGLGLSGITVMFNPLGFDWSQAKIVFGNGLLMLAALCWAVAILHVRAHRSTRSALELGAWQFLAGAIPLTIATVLFEGYWPDRWSAEFLAILIYNGPVATAFGFWAMLTITRTLPAITTSLGSLAIPVAGILASTVVLGEALTPTLLGGLGLILAGLACVATAGRRARSRR